MLHIIVIYELSQNGLDLNPQELGIRYFQRSHALYHVIYESSRNGLVFYIHQQVLGIRYFQRPCASYHRDI